MTAWYKIPIRRTAAFARSDVSGMTVFFEGFGVRLGWLCAIDRKNYSIYIPDFPKPSDR